MTDTNAEQPRATLDVVAWLEEIRAFEGATRRSGHLAQLALERFAELEATRRVLKRVLDTIGIHGGASEEQLIAMVKSRVDGGRLHRDELNPNNPVTQLLHGQWHKVAAILLMKLVADERRPELELTEQDVLDFGEMVGAEGAIVGDTRGGRFVLRLVDGAEAAELVREAGGLPA